MPATASGTIYSTKTAVKFLNSLTIIPKPWVYLRFWIEWNCYCIPTKLWHYWSALVFEMYCTQELAVRSWHGATLKLVGRHCPTSNHQFWRPQGCCYIGQQLWCSDCQVEESNTAALSLQHHCTVQKDSADNWVDGSWSNWLLFCPRDMGKNTHLSFEAVPTSDKGTQVYCVIWI